MKRRLKENSLLADNLVVLAHIGRPRGLNGWVYMRCYSRDPQSFTSYIDCRLRQGENEAAVCVEKVVQISKRWAALLSDCGDRTAAEALRGAELRIAADRLPSLSEGRYYWFELTGLRVCNSAGDFLGTVLDMQETGREDMMLVQSSGCKHLIPFAWQRVVRSVDVDARLIVVDWEYGD